MKHCLSKVVSFMLSSALVPAVFADNMSSQAETVYLHSKEISLPQFQMQQLLEDSPISDALFDATGNLWVIGRTSAWKWGISENALHRIKLTTNNEPLVSMEKSNGYLFVATDNHLFRIKFSPDEVIRFRHPAERTGKSGQLVSGQQSIWWIHDNGVAWFDQDGHLKSYPPLNNAPLKADKAWFDSENRVCWQLKGSTLVKIDYRHNPPKEEEVHRARHEFARIHGDNGYIMAHTNNTIIRFDNSSAIKQIIPVDGPRQIIASDINSNVHTYLFNDNLLEIYDIDKQVKFQSRLPLVAKNGVNSLLTQGSYSLVISDGIPHLFTHEKNLNISIKNTSPASAKG